ncbi:conserved hypothetical protein [Culex quinquefasciatus]|uniref:Uncharacterized protein n=1 Tax=Culex quinquefasciatus TaxID=7176 RepID=B0WLB9_CULQU|nr:conserved hypothetical protein [Culex quinquefasciatus]|eukprot:XP_001849503.1 conserved hypothetical protein [Culex quinquefasciatus]
MTYLRYVYFLLSFSLIGIVVLGLFGAYRCLRVATVLGRGTGTQTSEALATLPIQFITSDDLAAAVAAAAAGASINADSNHLPVPTLKVCCLLFFFCDEEATCLENVHVAEVVEKVGYVC